MPGGGIDWGESAEAAAHRELDEETGFTVTLGPVIGIFSRWFTKDESAAGEAGHMVGIVFDAVDVQGELRTTFDAGTTDDVRWFELDEVADLAHVELVDFVLDLLAERERPDASELGGVADEEVLHGGVANAGRVVRVGHHVLRPANPHSTSLHRMLTGLSTAGFAGASVPVGIDPDGRERLVFIPGDVAIPPYPAWAQGNAALGSIARLLRRMHDVSTTVPLDGDATWSDEMADPAGGDVFCHNDVCLENVVFRDGEAVGLLDFDFAAPGRREFDLAAFARMCVPIDDDMNAARLGWTRADRPARLRVVCDEYGLDAAGRERLLGCLDESIAHGGEFVRRRVEAGEVAFIDMWEAMGGQERFDRRRRWWEDARTDFEAGLR